MIAVVEAARAGLFRRDQWLRNIVAGVIVWVRKLVRAGLVGKYSRPHRYFRELGAALRASEEPPLPGGDAFPPMGLAATSASSRS